MTADITATLYDRGDLTTPVGTLEVSRDRRWQEPVSEPGAGSIAIPLDAPVQAKLGQLIGFDILGERKWTMLVQDFQRIAISQREEVEELNTCTGPGHLAVMKAGIILPANGLNGYPKQLDVHIDWRHRAYDDSAWTAPTEVESVIDAQAGGADPWPIIPWAPNMLGGDPGAETQILWAADGGPPASNTPMNIGTCYFRQWFTAPWDGTYIFEFATDDTGAAYIDGVLMQATLGGNPGGGFATSNQTVVKLSAGDHLLAVECRNWPAFPGILNLAGAAWNLLTPGGPGTAVMIVNSRNATSAYQSAPVMLAYPTDDQLGMTPGMAVRVVLEEIQSRGALTYVTLGFTDSDDSNGDPWNVTPRISTKVLTDLLTLLLEIKEHYVDVRMDPSSFELQMFNFQTMGTGSGLSFTPGTANLTRLEQHGSDSVTNALYGDYQGGYLEVEDAASIAANGRHEAPFALGSYDVPEEAERALQAALDAFKDPREQITVGVDGPVGYVDYQLGDTATTVDSNDDEVTERMMAITVTEDPDTGRVVTTPTLGDLVG